MSGQEHTKRDSFRRLFTYPLIRHSDMVEKMKQVSVEVISAACEMHRNDNERAAREITEKMEEKYGGPWHAVVGEEFGLQVAHEPESLLYMFYGGCLAVCLWKCA